MTHGTHDDLDLRGALSGLADVGRMWTRHGLQVGRSALGTAARTFDRTADLLNAIDERLGKRDAAPAGPASSTRVAPDAAPETAHG